MAAPRILEIAKRPASEALTIAAPSMAVKRIACIVTLYGTACQVLVVIVEVIDPGRKGGYRFLFVGIDDLVVVGKAKIIDFDELPLRVQNVDADGLVGVLVDWILRHLDVSRAKRFKFEVDRRGAGL